MRQDRSKDKSQSVERDHSETLELVEQLVAVLDRANLTEIRIRDHELEVQVSRRTENQVGINQVPALQTIETGASPLPTGNVESGSSEQGDDDNTYIRAPMPSRFYLSPSPDEPPYVQVGDTLNAGEPVAVLEVMKTYNPVEAPFNCEILEILAEDGDAVEYSQPLFRVKQV